MAMGRRKQKKRQRSLFVCHTAPQAPRHRFYEALEALLRKANFDEEVEALCEPHYDPDQTKGRQSIPPGVYFRMLLIGYFEGIESERGICWRCEDSLSLKSFLGYEIDQHIPDHSTLSRTRQRLSEDVYQRVFELVLRIVEDKGLLKGKVVGVDSTYLRADASMKSIVRKDTGQGYQEYLRRLAKEAGIENPTAEDLRKMDRKRKGKRTSNKDWESPVDKDSRVARLKDGRTRLAHKAEHVVDMESGAIIHADIQDATVGDASTIAEGLDAADERLSRNRDDDNDETPSGSDTEDAPRRAEHIKEVCADKGYHKAQTIREIEQRGIRSYIPERDQKGPRRFTDKGGRCTYRAFHKNRARVRRAKGKALQRKRGELIERSFAHICETGGHRRVRLRGRENIRKRYLLQTAGFNLGVVLRKLIGRGTPRGLVDARKGLHFALFVLWVALRPVAAAASAPRWWLPSYQMFTSAVTPRGLFVATSTGC